MSETKENPISDNANAGSILDRIMGSQIQSSLSNFEPNQLVESLLALLKERDREIVTKRFGLQGSPVETLEAIGKKHTLTRERVRQIEKDSLNSLRKKKLPELEKSLQLIFDTIIEHGNVMSEDFLMQTILVSKTDVKEQQNVKFLLNLGNQFDYQKETPGYWPSWSVVGFSASRLDEVVQEFVGLLKNIGRVISQEQLFEKFRASEYFQQHEFELSEKVIKSYLNVSKAIQINPFNEIGLKDWSEVRPRDVGDKAYLVLKHHGKPEHYSEITKMINDHKFDERVAYQETVHNELIKDSRFVLIGRGIYALSEWGYKKGVVADVIKEVIVNAGRPLTRDEIIDQVMKKRQVKRNTILVGLSNKKYFQKVGKDKYSVTEIVAE